MAESRKSHAEHEVEYEFSYVPQNKENCCPICRLSFHQPTWGDESIIVADCDKCRYALCRSCHLEHFDNITICLQIKQRNECIGQDGDPAKSTYCLNTCNCGKPVNPTNKCDKCTYCYCDDCFKCHHAQAVCDFLLQQKSEFL